MASTPQQSVLNLNLKQVTLIKDKVSTWNTYPFCVPAIQNFSELTFTRSICFFTGGNGTGKSTLLSAIATNAGAERQPERQSKQQAEPSSVLAEALQLTWNAPEQASKQASTGFYLPAETSYTLDGFFKTLQDPEIWPPQNSKQTIGRSFLKYIRKYCARQGTFFLDEPDDMLSPVEQLCLGVLLHDLVTQISGLQFIIVTHCSTLLAYPHAQIMSFNDGHIHPSSYRQYFKDFIYLMVEHPIVSLIFSSGLWRSLVTK
jgi:predicted ATPase